MNEITGQVFSVAKENRPVAGCTISKEVFSNGEDYILYFSLAKDTDISAEIYDYQKLIIVSDGNMEVYTNKDVWKLNSSDCILTPASIPVGMRTNTKAVYTEVSIRRSNINNAVNPGEVFKLADLLPYQDGKIVNMDIAHNDKMKFVVMSFDEGTGLAEHAAPGDLFIQKAPAATIGTLAQAVQRLFGDTGTRIIGTRHGEKLFETLMTHEERLRSTDMGRYFRVAADSRDLNYDKFVVEGQVKTMADEDYTSANTRQLDVEEMTQKLLTTKYIREKLAEISR